MRGAWNDMVRSGLSVLIRWLGFWLDLWLGWRLRRFGADQRRLRQRLDIGPQTPLERHGPALQARLDELSRRAGPRARMAKTSGSTASPKRLLYTPARLRGVKWAYSEGFARLMHALRIRRCSLYVLSALESDHSLTSLLLGERRYPTYLSTLQAPYRLHATPALRALAERHGAVAARVTVLALANPGVLYATNPSTLSAFLDGLGLENEWARIRNAVREVHPEERWVRRLASSGWRERFARIGSAASALPLSELAPGVEAYICWTGGYVQPFLERLERHLPAERYRRVPMYSMSTEVIETVPRVHAGEVAFLPVSPGVLYELLPAEAAEHPSLLLRPEEAIPGERYVLVVSDRFGLRRYVTEDVFLCRRRVGELPDLAFERRQGLAYSFTGEKLTGAQVAEAFGRLRAELPTLMPGDYLTCVPSQPAGEAVPHYKLVHVPAPGGGPAPDGAELAARFDAALCIINCEYAGKRHSLRLGPPRALRLPLEELVLRLGGERQARTWEAQLKLLPLYGRLWESLSPWTTVT